MAEGSDVAHLHPQIVQELMTSLEEQMPTFSPNVVAKCSELKQRKGDWSMPTGASPRSRSALGSLVEHPADLMIDENVRAEILRVVRGPF